MKQQITLDQWETAPVSLRYELVASMAWHHERAGAPKEEYGIPNIGDLMQFLLAKDNPEAVERCFNADVPIDTLWEEVLGYG